MRVSAARVRSLVRESYQATLVSWLYSTNIHGNNNNNNLDAASAWPRLRVCTDAHKTNHNNFALGVESLDQSHAHGIGFRWDKKLTEQACKQSKLPYDLYSPNPYMHCTLTTTL